MKKRFDLNFRPRTYWPRSSTASNRTSEAEIARISVSSSSRDVITLRARRVEGRLQYRMVHQDANGHTRHRIRVTPPSGRRLLSLRELIELLETSCYWGPCPDEGDFERFGGVIWGTLRLHLEHGIDHADDYVFHLRVSSTLYPQLEAYYQARVGEWCLANCLEDEDCGETVRLRTGSFPRKLVSLP